MSSDLSSHLSSADETLRAPTAVVRSLNRIERTRLDKVKYQAEIEARTNAGESCKAIATALSVGGNKISEKTVARWRVQWGLRQRSTRNTKGQPLKQPRINSKPDNGTRRSTQDVTKDRITQLMNDGKTADEIYEILQSEGVVMKKGVSTVWRLQTYWKLIPYDHHRANGTGPYNNWRKQPCRKKPDPRRVNKADKPLKGKKAAQVQEGDLGVQVQDERSLYYPANCTFGPNKRLMPRPIVAPTLQHDDAAFDEPMPTNSDSEPDAGFYDTMHEFGSNSNNVDYEAPEQPPWQQFTPARHEQLPEEGSVGERGDPVTAGSDSIMSAELLVDLANSAFVAATELKDLILAVQMHRPAPNSMSALPPSVDDIRNARRRVREAASVVKDLAMG
ncbi:hypothetical protein LTS10_008876 [Elasticomyces elasticus]|nr:hypothetical protein LTS10_008876 [Elasticomyces elasticus]